MLFQYIFKFRFVPLEMDALVRVRNTVNGTLYRTLVKPVCFRKDPERVHNFFIRAGKTLSSFTSLQSLVSLAFSYGHPALTQTLCGIEFKNPVGLSAGFDKNAELTEIIGAVGFGFAEVGSITAQACSGNSGIRLKRFPKMQSLWVNLGLNNRGVKEIVHRLDRKKFSVPIGFSVAKTNCLATTDPEEGLQDYLASVDALESLGDYITLNISCPNAYGGQQFSEPALFRKLARAIHQRHLKKPVFVKLSPDLGAETIRQIISIAREYQISGFICTNLTKKHSMKKGGLSGKFVEPAANKLLRNVYAQTQGEFVLIGAGGIFSAKDAYTKIKLGANLVQLITGMIYQGPQLISEINQGLVRLLQKDGYTHISQAVGVDVK